MLNLGMTGRAIFCATYIGAQLALIGFGLRAPDHVFGFQMFNEASRLRFQLFRKVRGRGKLVPLEDDAWQARDRAGVVRQFRWSDRVRYPKLRHSGALRHASYGLDAQLFRLQAALDDVAAHIPEDTETRALVAIVEGSKNGRPYREVQLIGKRRPP